MSSRFQRAAILLDQQRYDLAARELLEGLAQQPNSAWAHSALAICRSYQGQHDAAHWLAQRAIALAPASPDGYIRLAWTILRNPRCRPIGPLPWRFHLRRAWSYLNSTQPISWRLEEVERLTREALRLDPRELRAHGMLAGTLLAQARPKAALEAAERGLAVDPIDEHLRNTRARALMKLGRSREASDTALSTLAIHPESSDTHAVRGRALLLRGRSADAAEHFLESLRINPDDAETRADLLEAMKTRPLVFRLGRPLYVPYARRETANARSAWQWGYSWCAACFFVAVVPWKWPGKTQSAVQAAVAVFGVLVGVVLPAALLMMRQVGAYAFHAGSDRGTSELVLLQERLLNRLSAFGAGIVVGAGTAWFTGLPPVSFLTVAALAAIPGSAAGAAGDSEARRRLSIYAAAFAITASLIAVTAQAYAMPFRMAFLATGILLTLPPVHFAWRLARGREQVAAIA